MKFLLDENLSPTIASAMRSAGYDTLSVVEVGLAGCDDNAVRRYCVAEKLVLITLDADFGNILRYPPADTAGVLWLRAPNLSNIIITSLLLRVLAKLSQKNIEGCLVVADDKMIRIRSGFSSM